MKRSKTLLFIASITFLFSAISCENDNELSMSTANEAASQSYSLESLEHEAHIKSLDLEHDSTSQESMNAYNQIRVRFNVLYNKVLSLHVDRIELRMDFDDDASVLKARQKLMPKDENAKKMFEEQNQDLLAKQISRKKEIRRLLDETRLMLDTLTAMKDSMIAIK
jgi:hypothetical protein